jgi:hypothetical protein
MPNTCLVASVITPSSFRKLRQSPDFAVLLVIRQGSQLLKSGDEHRERAINKDPDELSEAKANCRETQKRDFLHR